MAPSILRLVYLVRSVRCPEAVHVILANSHMRQKAFLVSMRRRGLQQLFVRVAGETRYVMSIEEQDNCWKATDERVEGSVVAIS